MRLVCVSQRNFKHKLPCGMKTPKKCEGGKGARGKETEPEMKQSKLSRSTWQCPAKPP